MLGLDWDPLKYKLLHSDCSIEEAGDGAEVPLPEAAGKTPKSLAGVAWVLVDGMELSVLFEGGSEDGTDFSRKRASSSSSPRSARGYQHGGKAGSRTNSALQPLVTSLRRRWQLFGWRSIRGCGFCSQRQNCADVGLTLPSSYVHSGRGGRFARSAGEA